MNFSKTGIILFTFFILLDLIECGKDKEKAGEEPSSPRKVEESGGRSRGRGRGHIIGRGLIIGGQRPPSPGEGMPEHARAEEGMVGHGIAGEQLIIGRNRVKHKSSDLPPNFTEHYKKRLAEAQKKGKGIEFNEGGIPKRVKEMPQIQGKGKGPESKLLLIQIDIKF